MFTLNQIISFNRIFNLMSSIWFIIFMIFLIIIYHLIIYLIRDKKYIIDYNSYNDPDNVSIDDLNYLPLVNIIIPSWKEGQNFKVCLDSIKNLSYPKLKVIINAGGNDETIKIANTFKQYDNFIILHQKFGADRPSLGKIRAINECLDYIKDGLIYFIDADAIVQDETLLRIIYPIVNQEKYVVVSGRSLTDSLKEKALSKYLRLNRNRTFHGDFSRNDHNIISGSNTCIKYEVIERISKFNEERGIATDKSMALDINNVGYKIYKLTHPNSRMLNQNMPSNFKAWRRQRSIWQTNDFKYIIKFKKRGKFLKFLFLTFLSLYLLIFPIFLFFNITLFLFGFYLLIWIYFQKIRKIIFSLNTDEKESGFDINLIFYFKVFCFILLELYINIILIYDLIVYFKKNKKKTEKVIFFFQL